MDHFILFKGARIHFTDHTVKDTGGNKGRCIVLLHGFLESMAIWDEFAQSLSKRYRVVCIDLPGHGKSENIGFVHTTEMMAECVKEVLHSLMISKCVMVGHSMGGYVTLAFAEKYEHNLRGFALFHSHAAADPEEKKKDRNRAIQVVKRNPVVLINELVPNLFAEGNRKKFILDIEELIRNASSMTKQGIVNCMEGMKDRADRRNILQNARVPVLLMLGKKDPIMNFDSLKPQAELSEQIQLVSLEETGHMGFIESKEESLLAIKRFILRCHLPLKEGEE